MQVLAGAPTQLTLLSEPGCEHLAVTNGSEAASRMLLSRAALQLVDEHGNASPSSGQSVRISLQWPTEAEGIAQRPDSLQSGAFWLLLVCVYFACTRQQYDQNEACPDWRVTPHKQAALLECTESLAELDR